MKLRNPVVSIPYLDTDEDGSTVRKWDTLKFGQVMDHRSVKRYVRKWGHVYLGRQIHSQELRALVKRNRITEQ